MRKVLKIAVLNMVFLFACMLMLASCDFNSGANWQQGSSSSGKEHIHTYGSWVIWQNPTCTAAGERVRYCSCGEKQKEVMPATGHIEVADVAVQPTCTQEGLTEGKHCSACQEVLVAQASVEKRAHSYDDWAVTKQATCTADGERVRYCSCGEQQKDIIPATGHIEVTDQAVQATCTQEGLTEGKHCSVCQEVLVEQTLVKKRAHSYDDWTVVKKATCTAAGEKVRYCSCGEQQRETILATGHRYSSTSISASCEKAGGRRYTCDSCGHSYTEESGEALGHSVQISGRCSRCNADFSVDMTKRLGAPLQDDAKYGFSYYSNLDHELSIGFEAKNISNKTVKYAWVQIVVYNTVGDRIYSTTVKLTGPVKPGEKLVFNMYGFDPIAVYGGSVDFSTTAKVEIASVKFEYTDGTVECGSYGYSTTTKNKALP